MPPFYGLMSIGNSGRRSLEILTVPISGFKAKSFTNKDLRIILELFTSSLIPMYKKVVGIGLINFLIVAIIDIIWHGLLLAGYYNAEFGSISRTENGMIAPVVWAVILSDLIASIGMSCFLLTRRGKTIPKGEAMLEGTVFMLVYYFAANLAFYALLPYYPVGPIFVDAGAAIITGVVSGLVVSGIYNKWKVK